MKFLYQPVKLFSISQFFGQNNACVPIRGGRAIVCDGSNPPEGYKSVYSQMKGHNGLDVGAKRWQEVYSACDGIVAEVVAEEARGLGVGVITDRMFFCKDTNSNEYFHVRYWHHIANNVHVGDRVKLGDLLAYADSTGYSTADHLHFELKPVVILKRDEKGTPVSWTNLLQNNGYFGAVNPMPYLFDAFALEAAGIFKQARELIARVLTFLADKSRYGNR